MRLHLPRDLTDCPTGKSYWACSSNGFNGCCSVNPCDSSCSDDTGSSSVSPTETLTVSAAPSATAVLKSSTTSTSTTPSSSSSSSTFTTLTGSTSTPAVTHADLSESSDSAIASSTESSDSSNSPVINTPVIVGAVAGAVFISIMTILIWFCFRRRQQKRRTRKGEFQYNTRTKEFVLDRSTGQSLQDDERSLEGRHQSSNSSPIEPQSQAPENLPPLLPHFNASDLHIPSFSPHGSQTELATPIEATNVDVPLALDPEKIELSPPPEHEHPIYQPSPNDPHPGHALSPNLEPIAAHIKHSLKDLPSFLCNPTQSYEREQKYKSLPRRTSEVTRSTTTSRKHSLWQSSELVGEGSRSMSSPLNITPALIEDSPVHELDAYGQEISSPVKGRVELEGEYIPSSYLSPNPTTLHRMLSRSSSMLKRKDSRTRVVERPRSTSSPVGLGFTTAPAPTTTKPQNLTVITTTNSPTSVYSEHSFSQPSVAPTSSFSQSFHPPSVSLPPIADLPSPQQKTKSKSRKAISKPLPPTPAKKALYKPTSTQRAKAHEKFLRQQAVDTQMVGPKGPVFTSPLLMHSSSFRHLSLQTNFTSLGSVQEVETQGGEGVRLSSSAPTFTSPLAKTQLGHASSFPQLSTFDNASRSGNTPSPTPSSRFQQPIQQSEQKVKTEKKKKPTHHSSFPHLSLRTRMSHEVLSGAEKEVYASHIVSPLSPSPLSACVTLDTISQSQPHNISRSNSHSMAKLGHISAQLDMSSTTQAQLQRQIQSQSQNKMRHISSPLSTPNLKLQLQRQKSASRDTIIRANSARYTNTPSAFSPGYLSPTLTNTNTNTNTNPSHNPHLSSSSSSSTSGRWSGTTAPTAPTPLTPFTPTTFQTIPPPHAHPKAGSSSLNATLTNYSLPSSAMGASRPVHKLSQSNLASLVAECGPGPHADSRITVLEQVRDETEDEDSECECSISHQRTRGVSKEEECQCDDCDEERFDELKKGKGIERVAVGVERTESGRWKESDGFGAMDKERPSSRWRESAYSKGELTPLSSMSVDGVGEWGGWVLR